MNSSWRESESELVYYKPLYMGSCFYLEFIHTERISEFLGRKTKRVSKNLLIYILHQSTRNTRKGAMMKRVDIIMIALNHILLNWIQWNSVSYELKERRREGCLKRRIKKCHIIYKMSEIFGGYKPRGDTLYEDLGTHTQAGDHWRRPRRKWWDRDVR